MPPTPPRTKRKGGKFKASFLATYGLRKLVVDEDTQDVLKVICRFCEHGGRETAAGAQRRATTVIKTFVAPFRPDHFRQHITSQHASKWEEYRQLCANSQLGYFDRPLPLNSIFEGHFTRRGPIFRFVVKKWIVDSLIGTLFFGPQDDDATKMRALAVFEEDAEVDDAYVVKIPNKKQFYVVVELLSRGMTFRCVENAVASFHLHDMAPKMGIVDRHRASQYARVVCALNLQTISELLCATWTFSIAMDMSTHFAVSYLDIRIRMFVKGEILNVHLLAVPVFDAHTAAVIYAHCAKVLDDLCPDWKGKVISITTDGERKMTGCQRGVATLFEQASAPGFFRLWCGLHQLDISLQTFYSGLMDKNFYKVLTGLIGYLRRQQSLVAAMETQCPTIANTRWESASKVFAWFQVNGTPVRDYLDEKSPIQKPSNELWWIVINALVKLSKSATHTFKALQGKTTLVATQTHRLAEFAHKIMETFSIQGPMYPPGNETDYPVAEYSLSRSKKYVIQHSNTLNYFRNLGSLMTEVLNRSSAEEIKAVTGDFSTHLVQLVANVCGIVAERNSRNEAGEAIPPVLPHMLAKMSQLEFEQSFVPQKARLHATWSGADVEMIETDLQELHGAFENEPDLEAYLESCNDDADFQTSWDHPLLIGRFPKLRRYCGGLATAFPGTSTVESDFSHLKWEKDGSRMRLSNFGLEGVMQSKQFKTLDALNSCRQQWN